MRAPSHSSYILFAFAEFHVCAIPRLDVAIYREDTIDIMPPPLPFPVYTAADQCAGEYSRGFQLSLAAFLSLHSHYPLVNSTLCVCVCMCARICLCFTFFYIYLRI